MDISTDQTFLRQISQKVTTEEQAEVIASLKASLPDNSLGLAAPQIGLLKRAFLAKLDNTFYAFVNPEITFPNEYLSPSTESCLSIPDVSRCVMRHTTVRVKADTVVNTTTDEVINSFSREYIGQSACVLQHEFDHLNGVLLIDLPETKSLEDLAKERQQKRLERINKNKQAPKKTVLQKTSNKNLQKQFAEYKRSAKRLAKSEWINAAYKQQIAERKINSENSEPESTQP